MHQFMKFPKIVFIDSICAWHAGVPAIVMTVLTDYVTAPEIDPHPNLEALDRPGLRGVCGPDRVCGREDRRGALGVSLG